MRQRRAAVVSQNIKLRILSENVRTGDRTERRRDSPDVLDQVMSGIAEVGDGAIQIRRGDAAGDDRVLQRDLGQWRTAVEIAGDARRDRSIVEIQRIVQQRRAAVVFQTTAADRRLVGRQRAVGQRQAAERRVEDRTAAVGRIVVERGIVDRQRDDRAAGEF